MKFKFYLWSLLTLMAVSMTAVGCSDDDDVVAPTPGPDVPPVEEKMTFELSVWDIAADAAAFKAVPSDLAMTYYVDVVDAASFAGLTEDKMIEMILRNSDAEDLVSGVFEASAADTKGELKPETDYIFFALGYNEGKVVSELFTKSFTTLKDESNPEPQPEPQMTFELQVSNVTANTATLNVVPSDKRTYVAQFVPAAMFDQASSEQVIEMVLQNVKAEDLEQGQLEMTAEGLNPETEYVFFALGVQNGAAISDLASKRFTTLKASEPEPQPEVGAPKLTLTGEYIKAENILSFLAQCTSKNADEASYLITTKQMIDNLQNDGMDLDAFLASQGDKFSSSMLSKMNAEGARLTFGKNADDGFEATMPWSLLISAKNAQGKTLERCDVDPAEADFDLSAKMHANLTPGDKNGLNAHSDMMAHFSSDVNNMDRCYIAIFVSSELENALAGGQQLDQMILAQEQNVLPGAMVDLMNRGDQLHLSFSGLMESTSYTFAWLAYDKKDHKGVITSAPVSTKAKEDVEPEGPAISYFEVSPSNIYGFGTDHSVSCLLNSRDAVSGKVCVMETDRFFELSETLSPKDIVLQEGKDLTADEMFYVSNCKLQLVGNFSDLKANTNYRYGAVLFNAAGNASVRWGDTKTTPAVPHGNDAGCPAVVAEGWAGNAQKQFTDVNYSFRLQGAEVTGGVVMTAFPGDMIHQLFDAGSDAREIIDLMSSANPETCAFLTEDDCAAIRTAEGAIFTLGGSPNSLYTPIWKCHNAAGKAACGFIDIKTTGEGGGVNPDPNPNPDPEIPDGQQGNVKVELLLKNGDLNGEDVENFVTPVLKCLSKDAARAWYVEDRKENIDALVNSGKSLYEIVTTHPGLVKLREKPFVMDQLNSYGYDLQVYKNKMGLEYSTVAVIWNANGEYGVDRMDWKFAGADTEVYPDAKAIVLTTQMMSETEIANFAMASFKKNATGATVEEYAAYVDEMIFNAGVVFNFEPASFALNRAEINLRKAMDLSARAFKTIGLKRLANRF